MRKAVIEISYPGAVISCNHYKYKGGIYTKPEAKAWMDEFGWTVKTLHLDDWKLPLHVTCSARFKNKVCQPDLSNLAKCTLDSIEEVTAINDREMRWHDGTVEYGEPAVLWITIKEAQDV